MPTVDKISIVGLLANNKHLLHFMEDNLALKVTIKDVAKYAEVSVKTVSRVLNNSDRVNKYTRERVYKAIEALDYRPNAFARGLVKGKSHTIGLLIADISNPYFAEVVKGIESVALLHNYNLFLCNTNEDPERELRILALLREKQVDGVILSPSRMDDEEIAKLPAYGIPVVLINRRVEGSHIQSVMLDNETKGYEAGTLLARLGYTKIVYLSGPLHSESNKKRWSGFERAAREHGIEAIYIVANHPLPSEERGREAIITTLSQHSPPFGLFAFNDLMAIGAIMIMKKRNINIPEQVSVIGFDDIPFAAKIEPSLTTFHIPKREIGETAMNLLFSLINGESLPKEEVIFDAPLQIRGSCRPGIISRV
ncbi:MAG: LacI family transcriptional regulator [Firmicutes bacterium]|nr:LacI family transcriptional regulator [Bacillota bacterium]